jgi:HAD superfamily hydrolase (TIGR01549 family)
MKPIDAIFFDFDGVILESVDIKGWAFGKLFENYPKHVDEIVAFHFANGGMSRFNKFRYIYKNILKKSLSDDEFNALCIKFSDLTFKRVLKCEFVPGALEFIEKYYKKTKFYIISGTPQDEIEHIVEARGLSKYFHGVYGSPTDKAFWGNKIIMQEKLNCETTIFIGDAMSDYKAAKENGLIFVARINDDNKEIFEGKQVDYKVYDLFEFDKLLMKEN